MTYLFNGKDEADTQIIMMLWEEYKSKWPAKRDDEHFDTPWPQKLDMLQESIRRCMRAEYEAYLKGRVSKERVSQTRGHAILLGKIKATYQV